MFTFSWCVHEVRSGIYGPYGCNHQENIRDINVLQILGFSVRIPPRSGLDQSSGGAGDGRRGVVGEGPLAADDAGEKYFRIDYLRFY
ncbi:hypothetical protein Tco_0623333 [Tanacetum coccineum]